MRTLATLPSGQVVAVDIDRNRLGLTFGPQRYRQVGTNATGTRYVAANGFELTVPRGRASTPLAEVLS